MGIVPPNTDLTARPHWIQEWDGLTEDEKTLYARMMEVFAGFISHTDHHIGRVLDFLDETRRSGQHDHRRHLGQRRERRGWPARFAERGHLLQPRAGDASRSAWRASTSWARPSTSTTTRSAGRGRATRRSSAGSAKCTRAASPTPASCTGRKASRRGVRCAASTCTPSTSHRPCSMCSSVEPPRQIRGVTQSPMQGNELRAHAERCGGAERTTRRSTTRCSVTAPSTTAAGRPSPTTAPRA